MTNRQEILCKIKDRKTFFFFNTGFNKNLLIRRNQVNISPSLIKHIYIVHITQVEMSNLRGLKLQLENQRPWTDVDLKDPMVFTGQQVIVNCGPELHHAQGPACD